MAEKYIPDGSTRIQLETADRISLDLAGHLTMPRGWHGKAHAHPFWELIFIARGHGAFEAGGISYPAPIHSLTVFPPEQGHRFSAGDESEMLYLGFSFSLSPPRALLSPLPVPLGGHPALVPFISDITELSRNACERGEAAFIGQRLFLLSLLASVVETLLAPPASDDARHTTIASKIKEFIAANVQRNITLAEVAGNFYLSPHYVADIFRREAGVSIKAYHHALRMRKALELINAGGRTVTDVADYLGFENIHHFSKRFKGYFKMPPTRVRAGRDGFNAHADGSNADS